ncbi:anti-sigma factor family protein [candidate division KSB1 bacterium]
MKCNIPIEQLMDYFYGELENEELRDFENHLKTCADCKEELEKLELPSKALHKWEIPESRMNVVFMAEKESLTDRIRQLLPSFDWLKVKPAMKFAYGLAAVFLFLSITNFQFSYNSETGDLTFATSLFGSSESTPPSGQIPNDLLTQQILESQNRVLDMVTQVLSEREQNQNEQFSLALYELAKTIENQRAQELQQFGQQFINVLDPLQQDLTNTKNNVTELIKTVDLKKQQ